MNNTAIKEQVLCIVSKRKFTSTGSIFKHKIIVKWRKLKSDSQGKVFYKVSKVILPLQNKVTRINNDTYFKITNKLKVNYLTTKNGGMMDILTGFII